MKSERRKLVNSEMDRPGFGGRKPRGKGLATKKEDPRLGALDYSAALPMMQAMRASGKPILARVPWNEPGIVMKVPRGRRACVGREAIRETASLQIRVECSAIRNARATQYTRSRRMHERKQLARPITCSWLKFECCALHVAGVVDMRCDSYRSARLTRSDRDLR